MEEQKEKVHRLREETEKTAAELMRKVGQIEGDPTTLRTNPEVSKTWNQLCKLHVDAMMLCYQTMGNSDSIEDCGMISYPKTCVERISRLFEMMDKTTSLGVQRSNRSA